MSEMPFPMAVSMAAGAVLAVTVLARYLRPTSTTSGTASLVADCGGQGAAHRSVAVITGGGSGIGLAVALEMSRAGLHVVLWGRTLATLESAQKACLTAGAAACDVFVCDVTSPSDVMNTWSSLVRQMQQSDLVLRYVVLNAGAGAIVPFVNCHPAADKDSVRRTLKLHQDLLDVNYLSNVTMLQLIAATYVGGATQRQTRVVRVLLMSSLAGVLPSTLRCAYTGAKHALHGFINAVRGEIDPHRVTITLACPGYVDTAFHAKAASAARSQADDAVTQPAQGVVHRHGSMTPDVCAARSIAGMLRGEREVIFTMGGWLGYRLRPWLPSIIDRLAAKKSYRSVGSKPPAFL